MHLVNRLMNLVRTNKLIDDSHVAYGDLLNMFSSGNKIGWIRLIEGYSLRGFGWDRETVNAMPERICDYLEREFRPTHSRSFDAKSRIYQNPEGVFTTYLDLTRTPQSYERLGEIVFGTDAPLTSRLILTNRVIKS